MTDSIVKFVQTVENYPCLYNNTLQEYSRKDIIEKAWIGISQKMRWSVADCKDKWKNIRNNFVRTLKGPPSGSSAKAKKPYYLHDNLLFVLPYVRPNQHLEKCSSNPLQLDHDTTTEEEALTEENASNSFSQPTEKRMSPLQNEYYKEPKKIKREKGDDDITAARSKRVKKRKAKKEAYEGRRMFLMSLLPDVVDGGGLFRI